MSSYNHLVSRDHKRTCHVAIPVDGTQVWCESRVFEFRFIVLFIFTILIVILFSYLFSALTFRRAL